MFIAALFNLPAQSLNCAARAESSVKISSVAVITGAAMWNIARLDGQWLWFDATSDRGRTGEFGFLRFRLTELDGTKYSWDQGQVQRLIG